MRITKNEVLKIMLGMNLKEATGRQINQHNEELHTLYCSPNIIRVLNQGG
jgi:hypothetical protein